MRCFFNLISKRIGYVSMGILLMVIFLSIHWILPYGGFLELTIKQEEIEKIYFFVEGDEDYGIKEREFFLDNPNMMSLVISQLLTWERETIGDRNFCGQMPKSVGVYSYYGLVCIIQYRDKRLSWQKIYIKLDHNVSDERNQTLKDLLEEVYFNAAYVGEASLEKMFF